MRTEHIEVFNGPNMIAEFDVDYSTETIANYKKYTDNWLLLPFGRTDNVCYEKFIGFCEQRCPERGRADLKKLLRDWGLVIYDPVSICKVTRGLMLNDFLWIRFEGDEVTYDDIKIRFDFPDSV